MKLHELTSAEAKKARKRVGRGPGSGTGGTAGRGTKGQKARSGGGKARGFEGGQTPLARRLPKRGFTNINRKEYAVVNIEDLNRFEDGTHVTPELLKEVRLVRKELNGVKILGNGELNKKLTVTAHKFTKSAQEAITKAGGTTEVL